MIAFLLHRIGYGVLVIVAIVILVSSIIYLAPVDPARLTFGQRSDATTVASKKAALGLDKPLYIQLGWYLNDLSPIALYTHSKARQLQYGYWAPWAEEGQFIPVIKWPYLRESYQSGRAVKEMLAEAIPKTIILALAAMVIAAFLGIILGILAAVFYESWFDRLIILLSTVGFSIPSYVSAMVLALVFGYYWHEWTGLPVQGSLFEISMLGSSFGEERIVWANLILPSIALGVRPIAIITQLTRSSMLDVIRQDYIRTAKSKGLKPRSVWIRHALRNAMNPVITGISGWFAALLAGAFFVEFVFAYKGLGEMTITALLNFDIPVVLGAILFTAMVFVVINILTDLLYKALDPKVNL